MHELAGRTSKIGLTADSQGAPAAVALLVPPGVPVDLRGEGRDPLAHRGGFS